MPSPLHAALVDVLERLRARRLSTPLSTERSFSRAIWQLNLAFFEAVEPALKVADASAAFAAICARLGFAPDAPLAEVCRWHLERLGDGVAAFP